MEDRADQPDIQDHGDHPPVPVPYSDELLVDLVSARENLYDKGRVDYKDEAVRAAAWDSIANTFGMRVDECQTRWVRLRERFGRELRLHKRGAPLGKGWPLYNRMRWLERFIQPRNRVGGSKAQAALEHRLGDMGAAGAAAAAVEHDASPAMGAEEVSSAGPLWPHTFKLWARDGRGDPLGSSLGGSEEDSLHDMAVDMAANPQHPVAAHGQEDYHGQMEVEGNLGRLSGPRSPALEGFQSGLQPGFQEGFQHSVQQSLSALSGTMESIERHLSRSHGHACACAHAHDPDELFARSLAATLRRLPRPRRSQAKMKLIAVLAEFEDGP